MKLTVHFKVLIQIFRIEIQSCSLNLFSERVELYISFIPSQQNWDFRVHGAGH